MACLAAASESTIASRLKDPRSHTTQYSQCACVAVQSSKGVLSVRVACTDQLAS